MEGDVTPGCQVSISSTTNENAQFSDVESVAKSWMIDFSFISLCRYYRDKDFGEFSKTLRCFEAMVDGCQLQDHQTKKKTVCCLLARIMHGKNLDIHYDHDDVVTPLMSALTVWDAMRDIVLDATLHDHVRCLLFVQSIGVCLEKGNSLLATQALHWLERECELPQKLQMKLSSIVSKKDAYDQVFMSFSYSHLLDSVQTFLETFLADHPSDFLLKAASKVVLAHQEKREQVNSKQDHEESTSSQCSDISKEPKRKLVSTPFQAVSEVLLARQEESKQANTKPKRKLLPLQSLQPWKPNTGKKDSSKIAREAKLKVSRLTYGSETPQKANTTQSRTKKKWTYEEDKYLKTGVLRHGAGKWALMLHDFDFGGRTGVMLKDRWRTLIHLNKVSR